MTVCLPARIEIDDVQCGDYHSMFLAKSGELYACGSNEKRQLGLQVSELVEPQLVLRGICKIAAGVSNYAITFRAEIYVWGEYHNQVHQRPHLLPYTFQHI